jgi:hypothetical protein
LTSSTVDETAIANSKRQGSQGITIVGLHWNIRFDIQFDPYWLKWQTTCSKLTDKNFETSEFHQDMWNRSLMLGFVSANTPWNVISNLKLRRSYKVLRDHVVLPSTTTLSHICRREYALTVDTIIKQLLSRKEDSLALDGWTSTTKLALTSVITSGMNGKWALY